MSTLIKPRRFNWPALDASLSEVVTAINANRPVEGSGIRVTEGAAGCVIELSPGGGGAAGDGKKPLLLDTVGLKGLKWQDLTILNADCSPGTITVLAQGAPEDMIAVSIAPNAGMEVYLWASEKQPGSVP